MEALTKRQMEVLQLVRTSIATRGYAPTLEEIARTLGVSSLATVHKHMESLQRKGYVTRGHNKARSLELVAETSPRDPAALRLLADRDALLAALKRLRDLDVDCSQQEDRDAWAQAHAAIQKAEAAS